MQDHRGIVFLAILVLALAAQSAGAEVMDKEPSLRTIWLWVAVGATVAVVSCSWRPILAIISLPLTLALPVASILELRDPHVGKAIVAEAGSGYAASVYAVAGLIVLAHVAAVAAKIQRTRRREQRTIVSSGPG